MRRIRLARFLQRITDLLPRKYPVIGKEPLEVQPVFVFGSGRNGSTLLNRMLNQHSKLFLPPEQYFLGNNIAKYKLYNFMIWRDLVKVMAGELIGTSSAHRWDFDPAPVLPELFHLEKKSLQRVIDVIYRKYGSDVSPGFEVWGDTTPLNTYYLPEIFSVFPGAKYVFLLRDPRDVVASYKRGGQAYLGELSAPRAAAAYWNQAVTRYDWIRRRASALLVRYEELVTHPEETLRGLLAFLGLDYEAVVLSHHTNSLPLDIYKEPQHANLQKTVFNDSVGRWREALTEKEEAIIHPYIMKNLNRFGYL